MKIRTFAAALALAGTPAIVAAQQTQAPAAGQHEGHGQRQGGHRGRWQQGGERRGGIQGLIARKDQLHLTSDQVSRLQGIQQRLESQNRPLQERMRALFQQSGLPDFHAQRREGQRQGGQAQGQRRERGQRPQLTEQQRQQLRQLREQSKPIRDQLRQNQQAAMRDVQAILTPAQKQQLQQ